MLMLIFIVICKQNLIKPTKYFDFKFALKSTLEISIIHQYLYFLSYLSNLL